MKPETYIDIHSHKYYKAPDTVLLLNTFPEESEKLNLPVWISVGLHPWHIEEGRWQNDMQKVEKTMQSEKVLAIGEAGLDKVVKVDYTLQQLVFSEHIRTAEQHYKPMVIHCVRSYSEMLAYRKRCNQKLPWIFHWFNSDTKIAEELIRKNCFLSFGHMLFHSASKAYTVFKNIPIDHVFFETDDAGVTIKEVYSKACEIKNMELPVLQSRIVENFNRCFHL